MHENLRNETLEADFEVLVFQCVYERIDAAVGERGEDGEVVETAVEADRIAEEVHGDVYLVASPTHHKASEHDEECFQHIPLGGAIRVCCRIGVRRRSCCLPRSYLQFSTIQVIRWILCRPDPIDPKSGKSLVHRKSLLNDTGKTGKIIRFQLPVIKNI